MRQRGLYLLVCLLFALAGAAEAGETTNSTYDALGRLTAASSTGTINNGVTTAIGYDPGGNRSNYRVSGLASTSVGGSGFESPEVGASYQYRPTTAFTAVTSPAFTAAAGSGTLIFTGQSYAGDTGIGLDKVSIAKVLP
jgi:hypothetical protein